MASGCHERNLLLAYSGGVGSGRLHAHVNAHVHVDVYTPLVSSNLTL
jgi:hypothetical protein